MKTEEIEELFLKKYGNKITASESWVIRFAEGCVKLSEQLIKEEVKVKGVHPFDKIKGIDIAIMSKAIYDLKNIDGKTESETFSIVHDKLVELLSNPPMLSNDQPVKETDAIEFAEWMIDNG